MDDDDKSPPTCPQCRLWMRQHSSRKVETKGSMATFDIFQCEICRQFAARERGKLAAA